MNSELKQKLEEAARKHWEADNRNLDGVNPHAYILGFKTGASHLYRNGYRFTEEDMREAFYQGIYHQYPPNKGQAFEEWIEERNKNQNDNRRNT